jgi:2,5-furandicarboxylate decarboxylase 1
MEASRDIIMVPGARGHEYVRVSHGGIRTKLGIDATVPFAEKARFARCEFEQVPIDAKSFTADAGTARKRLGF